MPTTTTTTANLTERLPFTFGVEVEFNAVPGTRQGSWTQDDVTFHLNQSSIPNLVAAVASYGQRANGKWLVKVDGSCGLELVTPVLSTYGDLETLKKAVLTLKALNFQADSRCGLHVHFGFNHLAPDVRQRVLKFLMRYEAAFFALAPERRSRSTFCAPLTGEIRNAIKSGLAQAPHLHDIAVLANFGRYLWINGQAFSKHGTIEVRLQEGTLDPELIIGWVLLFQQVLDAVVNGGVDVCYGEAKASSKYMLVYTMLQQAQAYGKSIRNVRLAKAARKFVGKRFKQLCGAEAKRPAALTHRAPRATAPAVATLAEMTATEFQAWTTRQA